MLSTRNVVLSALFLLVARPLLTGQGSDSLRITVVDENGSPVPSARISLQLAKRAVYANCESDFAGRCTLAGLSAGAYSLHIERQGFYVLNQPNVRVGPYPYDLEVSLHHLEEVKETVNVTETYCEIVPVTTTVRVPVWPMQPAGCCPAPEKLPAPAAPAVPTPRAAI